MSSYAEHPAAGSPDGLLVRAYLAGDPTAFDTLYERYSARIVGFLCRRCGGDKLAAEELAQETWTRALEHLPRFDQRRRLLPYLYAIADNLLPAVWRRRAAEVPVDEIRDNAVSIADDSERIVTIDAVNDALAKLPARQRDALFMRYAEDRDGNELAAFFGLNRNAFEQLLARARRAMRKEYRGPAVLVPGLLARLRRFGSAAGARLQAVGGASLSVAGELAIGAAITAGGIGLVINGPGPDAADGRVARAVAGAGDRAAIAYERTARDLYSGVPIAAGDVAARHPGALGALPGEVLASDADGWDTGAVGEPAPGAAPGAAGDVPGGGENAPAGQNGAGTGAHSAEVWVSDTPDSTVYVAPPNVGAAPEADVWVDPDGKSGGTLESDETDTSGQVALNRKIAQEGEIASETVETQVADVPVSVGNDLYTHEFDTCYELMLC
jgi:RNA polymerase sigma-70 factor (ECF subfamily)